MGVVEREDSGEMDGWMDGWMNWGRSLYLRAGLWNGGCCCAFMVWLVEEPAWWLANRNLLLPLLACLTE